MKEYIVLTMDWYHTVTLARKVTAETALDAAFQDIDFANEVERIRMGFSTEEMLDKSIIDESRIEGFTAVYSANECLVGLIEI